jgi:hypothetical protein
MQQEHETIAVAGNRTVQARVTHVDPLVSDQGRIGAGHGLSLGEIVIDGSYNHSRSSSGKDLLAGSSRGLFIAQSCGSKASARTCGRLTRVRFPISTQTAA